MLFSFCNAIDDYMSFFLIGVISHKFTLPQLVNDGFWKIRVEALDQIEDQNIRVEKYFSPLFEV